jgi:S1-C subfamily serine protease
VKNFSSKKIFIAGVALLVIVVAVGSGAVADRVFGFRPLDKLFPPAAGTAAPQPVVSGVGDVVGIVKEVGPSVVTVSGTAPARQVIQFNPFTGFTSGTQGGTPQNIGSGFIVSSDGLVVTNKHVVSDTTMTYTVTTSDGKTHNVNDISRDPNNDIAVLKIDATGLASVQLGDSSNLQVGQFVIAIGTALGQFPNTVTTGVISGLGRGINATGGLQGYVEQLDNVIQTDAAINPGNSGGPLLNAAGQVIGINVAVAQGANNIAFSIPVNTVKDALNVYKSTGKFPAKAYLGVEYQVVAQQGMYIVTVITGSPADKAGIQVGDIISKIDGVSVATGNPTLSSIIASKKPGDTISLDILRNGQTINIKVTLSESPQ